MSARELLNRYLRECPLVAIIRGVSPDEAEAIGDAIYEGGIRIIEVPLNSPDPLNSIERLAKRFGDQMLVGAGTVLDRADVARVSGAGGRIIVSPDTNVDVISRHCVGRARLEPRLLHAIRGVRCYPCRSDGLEAVPRRGRHARCAQGAACGHSEGRADHGGRWDQTRTTCGHGWMRERRGSGSAAGSISPGNHRPRRSTRPAPMSQD